MSTIPFQAINWQSVEKVEYKGDKGVAYWQTIQFAGFRIRLVEYSKDYLADHWCQKGHIVHCLSGSFIAELNTGEQITLSTGDSFVVSDDASSHLLISAAGAKLLIVDGEFLNL
jgi:quercetin dioxygenase-like cupin family protein